MTCEKRKSRLLIAWAAAAMIAMCLSPAAKGGTKAGLALEEGKIAFSNEQYGDALALFELALAEDSENGEAHQYAGLCNMALDRPGRAVDHFELAVNYITDDHGLYEDLAWAALADKDAGKALSAADNALSLDPGSDRANLLKGQAQIGLGRYNQALDSLAKVNTGGDYGQSALYYTGIALTYLGRTSEAEGYFVRARDMAPNTATGREAASYVESLQGGGGSADESKPWSFRFRVLYQFDDNMALVDDEDLLPEDVSNKEDSRMTLDLDARYTFLDRGGFSAYARYVGYSSFQFEETDLNILHNIGQLGTFYTFQAGGFPVQVGAKCDFSHSMIEGYWYEYMYKASPEASIIWNDTMKTRVVLNFRWEVFEEPGDDDWDRDNSSMEGVLYQHFNFMDGKINAWLGYGYGVWEAEGDNYNRVRNSVLAGGVFDLPLDLTAVLFYRYDMTDYVDFDPDDREENKHYVNASLEIPVTDIFNGYAGVSYTTVDANESFFEYDRMIYSAGFFIEM